MSLYGKADNQEFFNTSGSYDYDLQAETSDLINQVFNQSNYEPVFDPETTKARQELYRKAKQKQNKQKKHKLAHHPRLYQNLDQDDLSPSFVQFLSRAQQKVDLKYKWIQRMKKEQNQRQKRSLKQIPDILRGSREKIEPIFERCIDLQKSKDRRIEEKRIKKSRQQSQNIRRISFKPKVNPGARQRTFDQYLQDKLVWEKQRKENLEKKKTLAEVSSLSQCTFAPQLVSNQSKFNLKSNKQQKVEDRLLRSLQKSMEKIKHNQCNQ